LDPDEEEEEASSLICLGFANNNDGIVMSYTQGRFSEDQYFMCTEAARKGSQNVCNFMRLVNNRKYESEFWG